MSDVLPRGIPDRDWIKIVAERGWVAVTGNQRIRTNPAEAAVAVGSQARIICVHDSKGDLDTWRKLSLLLSHWRAIESHVERNPDGPWWLSVTPSGAKELTYKTRT